MLRPAAAPLAAQVLELALQIAMHGVEDLRVLVGEITVRRGISSNAALMEMVVCVGVRSADGAYTFEPAESQYRGV